MINHFLRYQKDLILEYLYPKLPGICACGCNVILTGRKTKWASRECNDKVYKLFSIIKGNNSTIRKEVFNRDEGFCRNCGVYDHKWEADHILPVHKGGGGCTLENFQTLCYDCHKEKTKKDC